MLAIESGLADDAIEYFEERREALRKRRVSLSEILDGPGTGGSGADGGPVNGPFGDGGTKLGGAGKDSRRTGSLGAICDGVDYAGRQIR